MKHLNDRMMFLLASLAVSTLVEDLSAVVNGLESYSTMAFVWGFI